MVNPITTVSSASSHDDENHDNEVVIHDATTSVSSASPPCYHCPYRQQTLRSYSDFFAHIRAEGAHLADKTSSTLATNSGTGQNLTVQAKVIEDTTVTGITDNTKTEISQDDVEHVTSHKTDNFSQSANVSAYVKNIETENLEASASKFNVEYSITSTQSLEKPCQHSDDSFSLKETNVLLQPETSKNVVIMDFGVSITGQTSTLPVYQMPLAARQNVVVVDHELSITKKFTQLHNFV